MGGVSIWHWIVVGVIVMLLFGRGKVSELMGDVAKGIKSFKKGMAEDDEPAPGATNVDPKVIDQTQAGNAAAQAKAEHKA
ncbi:twin-arginine translocase TatA/TatE family subunit [Bosea minatitlanensis]|uniref:Sec-independent protein translocase protein TatA n=1 Tax=Bosea minatitlanensis TaxID=128782 RepID=A0ABW0EW28_9HYPH|nr:twin-arginine translocase TatA/TatE family subunit [Bosea minatitlanensis]MCT4496030.1 twin-arginine translocase TatA/TatE family subunit [Bosea minatitlanensis]